MRTATTALERVAIVLASLVLSIGLIAALSGFFAGRDAAGVSTSTMLVGLQYPDQGHAHLAPGQPHPPYNSDPPTSGPHVPVPILREDAKLTDDQLLQALETGNIVVAYGTPRPPAGLMQLARSIAGPFSPALALAGQAVVLDHRPGTAGLIGLAWTRMVRVSAPNDTLLRTFAEQLLGKGASGG